MFKIFDKLGGESAALEAIQRRRCKGFRPSHRAVLDWKRRKEIPPVNAVLLLAECQERGIRANLEDCRLSDKAAKSFSRPRGQGRARP